MTAMRRVRDLLQGKGYPTEFMQGLAQGETQSKSQAGAAVVEVDLEAEIVLQ